MSAPGQFDLRQILDPLPVDKAVKAKAWDDFHGAASPEDFRARFDSLPIPKEAKAALWDGKFGGAAPQPSPTVPGMEQLGGTPPAPWTVAGVDIPTAEANRLASLVPGRTPGPEFLPVDPAAVVQGATGAVKLAAGGTPTKPKDPREAAQGAADLISGAMGVATSPAGMAAVGAPAATVLLRGVAEGLAAGKVTRAGLESLGVPKEYVDAAEAMATFAPGAVRVGRAALEQTKPRLQQIATERRIAREYKASSQPSARGKETTVEVLPPEQAPPAEPAAAPPEGFVPEEQMTPRQQFDAVVAKSRAKTEALRNAEAQPVPVRPQAPVPTQEATPEAQPVQEPPAPAPAPAPEPAPVAAPAEPAVVAEPAAPREPWQMTRSEFEQERPQVSGYRYHGSPEGDLQLIDPYYHTRNWREGIGFYSTESRDVAGQYANGRTARGQRKNEASGKGRVNYLEGEPQNALDMDAKFDETLWPDIAERMRLPGLFAEDQPKTNGEAYRAIIDAYNEENMTSEGQYAAEEILSSKGYDASTHTEGVKIGKPHRVTIWKSETNVPKVVSPAEVHLRVVQQALAEGKPVPAEVLKEYPDLQAKPNEPPASSPRQEVIPAETSAVAEPEAGSPKGANEALSTQAAQPVEEAPQSAPQAAERGPGFVGNIPTAEIQVDPPRFQFKANVGQGGAGEEFRGVTKWDPEKAGVISVWRDPANGKTYVVNGHHRLEMAQRLKVPEVTVRYLRAQTAQEARHKGALINIAEGRGESTDAAKVFRDSGATPEALQAEGVSLRGKIASEGLALSRLSTPIFNDVISGDLSPARGAVIGAGIKEHADQEALYDLIKQREKGGKRLTNDQIGELIRLTNEAPKQTETQDSLFGAEEMTRSLLPEKAEVSDYIRKQLATERKLFGAVGTQAAAEKLSEAGNVIKAGENAQQAERANQGILLYDKLSVRSGPIATVLDRAARSIAEGESAHEVKQRAYREIRNELSAQVRSLNGSQGDVRRVEGLGSEGPLHARRGESGSARRQESIVSPEEDRTIRQQGEQYKDRLLGERLTAQFKSGLPAKPSNLKPAQNRGLFDVSEGPEQQPLFARIPIEGQRYRAGAPYAEIVQEAKVAPARAGREHRPVIYTNGHAMDLVHRILGTEGGGEALGATFTSGQTEKILKGINQELRIARLKGNKTAVKTFQALRDAIEENRAAAKGGPMVLVQSGPDVTPKETAGALAEELNHALQLEATGDLYAYHVDVPNFLNSPAGSKAAEVVRAERPDIPDSAVAMEIGVRLMEPGRYQELGLTESEALDLADQYTDLLIDRHGPEKVAKVVDKVFGSFRRNLNGKAQTSLASRRKQGTEQPQAAAGGKGGGGKGRVPEGVDGDAEPLQQRKGDRERPRLKRETGALANLANQVRPALSRIAQEGEAGKELARRIDHATDVGERRGGLRVTRLLEDAKLQNLTKEQKFALVDALEGGPESTDAPTKKALEITREVLSAQAQDATAAGIRTKVKRFLQPSEPIPPGAKLTAQQQKRRANGHSVFVQYDRPFSARKNYFPHRIPNADLLAKGEVREDVARNLVRLGHADNLADARTFIDQYIDFLDTGKRTEAMINHLLDSGQAKTRFEALGQLMRFRRKTIKRAGSLEYSREIDLPFWDPDPSRVLPGLVQQNAIVTAQRALLGPKQEVVKKAISQIRDAGGDFEVVQAAVDSIIKNTNEADTGAARAMRALRVLQGFKLGLSAINNVTQGPLNTLLAADARAVVAGARGALTKKGRRFGMESGAATENVIHEAQRALSASNELLGKFLKGTGFAETEFMNRAGAAVAGADYAARMARRLKLNPKDSRARAVLERLGIQDVDALIQRGKMTAEEYAIAGKRFADQTQGRNRPQDMPLGTQGEVAKTILQFKTYGYNQAKLVTREVYDEFRAGRFGRGFRNLLLMAAVFPLAGEVTADIRSLITGRKRPTKALDRYTEDFFQLGTLGLAMDAAQAAWYGRLSDWLVGPTAGAVVGLLEKGAADAKRKSPLRPSNSQFLKEVVRMLPMGTMLSSRLFPKQEREKVSPEMRKLLK